jgi:hypothetical protein
MQLHGSTTTKLLEVLDGRVTCAASQFAWEQINLSEASQAAGIEVCSHGPVDVGGFMLWKDSRANVTPCRLGRFDWRCDCTILERGEVGGSCCSSPANHSYGPGSSVGWGRCKISESPMASSPHRGRGHTVGHRMSVHDRPRPRSTASVRNDAHQFRVTMRSTDLGRHDGSAVPQL